MRHVARFLMTVALVAIPLSSGGDEGGLSKHLRDMRQAVAEAEQMVQLPQPHEALHRAIFRDLREWSSAGLSQHLATFSTCNATGEDSVCVWTLGAPPRLSVEVWCVVRTPSEIVPEITPDERGHASDR